MSFLLPLQTFSMKKKLLIHFLLVLLIITKGSAQVTKLSNNTNIQYGAQVGSRFLLVTEGGQLWSTDGTPGGTTQFTTKVIADTAGSLAFFNSKVYFSGIEATNGSELWVTDGTDAGTTLVKNIRAGAAGSVPDAFFTFNGSMYFTADDGANGRELYKSDGSSANTVLFKDINTGAPGGMDTVSTYFINNGKVFFMAEDATHGREPWVSDGTLAGTVMLKDITSGGSSDIAAFAAIGTQTVFARYNGGIFFGSLQLWNTDGTEANTSMIKDFGFFSAIFTGFTSYNSKLYFTGTEYLTTGTELWNTDGTTGGTAIVKDIYSGLQGSNPILFNSIAINGKLMFMATNKDQGSELWTTDGTGTGTTLFYDINNGKPSATPFIMPDISYELGGFSQQLYNGQVFFSATDGAKGSEPWITDGTVANTHIVKDIRSGSGSSIAGFTSYYYTSAGLYFAANDGSSGSELWKSDGTEAGTFRVQDIFAGGGSSDPQPIYIYNNHLYFTADDGDNANGDRDLYVVDATLGTLPQQLLSFNAMLHNDAVQLNWNIISERNSSGFNIQRSADGIHFTTIGNTPVTQQSETSTAYHFTDAGVLKLGAPTLYYRLQMMKQDGTFSYSKTAVINIQPYTGSLKVFPNPAKNQLYVLYNAQTGKQPFVRITDVKGTVVLTQQLSNAQTVASLNISSLQPGVYYLQMVSEGNTQKIKFIKQ